MRLLPHPRGRALSDRGVLRPLEAVARRGALSIRGGIATRVLLSAPHFDPWGAQAYGVLNGIHEPMVQEALRRTVPPGGVVYDVGANIGFMTVVAARLAGPSGTVAAFEPEPWAAAAVRAGAALNGMGQVQVLELAAGASSMEGELIVVDDSLWTRLATVGEHDREVRRDRVPVAALDDLVAAGTLPPPDVVKIDVEGAELDVLAGMRTILRDHRPHVICEMHGKNAAFAETMEAAGYRVTNLDGPVPLARAGGNVHAHAEPPPRA